MNLQQQSRPTSRITSPPQTPVRIEKLFAEVGDHVKAGQLLVKMDETTSNRPKYNWTTRNWSSKRIDELYKVGGASKSAWDAQKTQLDISRATYKNLQENTQLLSPITGIVTARNYDSEICIAEARRSSPLNRSVRSNC